MRGVNQASQSPPGLSISEVPRDSGGACVISLSSLVSRSVVLGIICYVSDSIHGVKDLSAPAAI